VLPKAIIAGPKTGIRRIRQVEVDSDRGKIYVAVKNNAESYRFDEGVAVPLEFRGARLIGVWDIADNGDVPPRAVIKGPASGVVWPAGVALNPKDRELYTIDSVRNGMFTFPFGNFSGQSRVKGVGEQPAIIRQVQE